MNRQVDPTRGALNQTRVTQLLEKWAPVLNFQDDKVAPITDERARYNTAVLLENQEQHLLETSYGGVYGPNSSFGNLGSSDQYAQGDARLPKVLIPMVRRTFPELITNEIVGVQPMAGPVGMAFAMRYKYDNTALGGVVGGSDGRSYGDLEDGDPGAGKAGNGTSGAAETAELGYNYLNTAFTGKFDDSIKSNANYQAVSGDFALLDEDLGVATLLKNYELTGNIPQVTVSYEKVAVEAGTRRLAAKWSVELEQDLKNMNGLDIDAELTNTMSYEIQAEIDREMIIRMIKTCFKKGSGAGYSYWNAASADARWLGERTRDFYSKLIVEANRIAVRNRRGAANFIIATPRVCAMMEMLPEFQWMPVNGSVNTQPTGISKVGTLGGRFTIYRDTRTEAQTDGLYGRTTGGALGARASVEYALLGYKGSEYYDTGIIYCPYIPVMIQRTVGVNDFAPRVGLMTRYGVVDYIFGADLYYHLVIVKGLGTQELGNGGIYLQ
jgi:hypothetical protein